MNNDFMILFLINNNHKKYSRKKREYSTYNILFIFMKLFFNEILIKMKNNEN